MKKAEHLLKQLRAAYQLAADPARAPEMQRYMKSEMSFHGVPSPISKKICKDVFKELEFFDDVEWRETIIYLWDKAQFREERYACLALCAHKNSREFQNLKSLVIYEKLIVSGAWWDFVDEISHRINELLLKYPAPMTKKMLAWSRSKNIWKRRSSIICQLHTKGPRDLKLMYACIEASLDSKEFFLQKAIGWALRQHAWRDPKEVRRYVKSLGPRLAPLSQREALKNIS